MNEIWKQVVGYESHYAVSSLGRVQRTGPGRGATPGRILAPCPQGDYLAVSLYQDDDKTKIGIHILVTEAFYGPRPDGMVPNHKDADKHNNSADNLEWLTHVENVRHAAALGLIGGRPLPGALNGRAKLTSPEVAEIRSLKGIASQRALARRFCVARTTIQWIHQGKHWKASPEGAREFPT